MVHTFQGTARDTAASAAPVFKSSTYQLFFMKSTGTEYLTGLSYEFACKCVVNSTRSRVKDSNHDVFEHKQACSATNRRIL
jgi:hypothetical protein